MKNLITKQLAECEVTVNGGEPWDIQVHDDRWYRRVATEGSLGLGESYMDGWWSCEQIDVLIEKLLRCGSEWDACKGLREKLQKVVAQFINLQSRARSRKVARKHYDLGNDLFFSFLDPYRQYSCAYFKGLEDGDLQGAQQAKLQLIADKLKIRPEDHVLDIGCGWGGLARFIAEQYGCQVKGVNISKEQLKHARKWCEGLPVEFMECDYRSLDGSFDKIVSVGMFEHVGHKNYRPFMQVAHRCLKDDGAFLLHTIGCNYTKTSADPWIRKYIFCNSMLPSMAHIAKASERLFVIEDWHSFGHYYDKTLMAWYRNFQDAWPKLKDRYDERFKRMWDYYLLSCAGGFRSRRIQLWQVLMSKYGCAPRVPITEPRYD